MHAERCHASDVAGAVACAGLLRAGAVAMESGSRQSQLMATVTSAQLTPRDLGSLGRLFPQLAALVTKTGWQRIPDVWQRLVVSHVVAQLLRLRHTSRLNTQRADLDLMPWT